MAMENGYGSVSASFPQQAGHAQSAEALKALLVPLGQCGLPSDQALLAAAYVGATYERARNHCREHDSYKRRIIASGHGLRPLEDAIGIARRDLGDLLSPMGISPEAIGEIVGAMRPALQRELSANAQSR